VTYCECCKHFDQHWFEDKGYCNCRKKQAEATDDACEDFKPLDGQIKLEV